ncbi:MAG TPA: hypothetical protein PLP39_03965 [Flavobacterium lutivivi]|nr:hypothetical protein [Flavobacterium lutivivi]
MKLTEENYWAFELANLYQSKNQENLKIYFKDLLDLLIYLHEILAEDKVPVHESFLLSEELIIKFYFHGVTINKISEGFNFQSKYFGNGAVAKEKFVDVSSILTVGRSQLETLLMYQHLYINSQNEKELWLRYYAWIYTALLQRSTTPATTEETKQKKEADIKSMEVLRRKMESLFPSTNLSEKQQKSLIEKGNGKLFKNWDTIFKDSGFSNGIFTKLYYILSAYAHTEGLSVIQMKSAKYNNNKVENSDMIFMQLFSSTIMTAVMIENICKKHESCKNRFENIDKKLKYTVKFLSQICFTNV